MHYFLQITTKFGRKDFPMKAPFGYDKLSQYNDQEYLTDRQM